MGLSTVSFKSSSKIEWNNYAFFPRFSFLRALFLVLPYGYGYKYIHKIVCYLYLWFNISAEINRLLHSACPVNIITSFLKLKNT